MLTICASTLLPLGQCACAWHVWEKAASPGTQESWAKSCSLFPRKAPGFGYMDKLPQAPAACVLALCTMLLLSGEIRAKCLNAF